MTDVVTDPEYRGNGAAKQLMETMVNCDELRELRGVLLTKDAMPLYESVGFGNYAGTFMLSPVLISFGLNNITGRRRCQDGELEKHPAIWHYNMYTLFDSKILGEAVIMRFVIQRVTESSVTVDEKVIGKIGKGFMEPEESSATVELAAQALGTEPRRIAKSMSFLVDDGAVIVVMAGDAKVDNRKYKDQFHQKAKMIPFDEVEGVVGHAAGGVCPFAINEGIKVYLDESMQRFDTVFPA